MKKEGIHTHGCSNVTRKLDECTIYKALQPMWFSFPYLIKSIHLDTITPISRVADYVLYFVIMIAYILNFITQKKKRKNRK